MTYSTQTLLCTYLSAVLLVGLAVDSLFGWWGVDPAALVIVAVEVKESREAWRGEGWRTGHGARVSWRIGGRDCADGWCTPEQPR